MINEGNLKQYVENVFHDQWLNPEGDAKITNSLYFVLTGSGLSGAEVAAIELQAMGRAIASLEEFGIDASHIKRNLPMMERKANGR